MHLTKRCVSDENERSWDHSPMIALISSPAASLIMIWGIGLR